MMTNDTIEHLRIVDPDRKTITACLDEIVNLKCKYRAARKTLKKLNERYVSLLDRIYELEQLRFGFHEEDTRERERERERERDHRTKGATSRKRKRHD